MNIVSESVRFVQIFAGVPKTGGAERQWGSRKWRCSDKPFLGNFRLSSSRYYTVIRSPDRQLFSDHKMRECSVTLNDL